MGRGQREVHSLIGRRRVVDRAGELQGLIGILDRERPWRISGQGRVKRFEQTCETFLPRQDGAQLRVDLSLGALATGDEAPIALAWPVWWDASVFRRQVGEAEMQPGDLLGCTQRHG